MAQKKLIWYNIVRYPHIADVETSGTLTTPLYQTFAMSENPIPEHAASFSAVKQTGSTTPDAIVLVVPSFSTRS